MSKTTKIILIIFLAVVIFLGFAFSVTFFAMKMLKGNAYKLSWSAITQHEEIKQEFGSSLKASWWVLGNVNLNNSSGNAAIEYKLTGTKSSGNVFVEATRTNKVWTLDKVIVIDDSANQRVFVVRGEL